MLLFPAMTLFSCGENSVRTPALDITDLDLSVAPGENFYLYANGGWMAKNPLKAEYARYGSFDQLSENNEERLNALFKEMAEKTYTAGTVEQKISDLYKQGLDSVRRNEEGAAPLKKYIDAIYGTRDKAALIREIGELNKIGEGGFFGAGVMEDLMDSDNQILYMTQTSLGMGEKDYYVNPANAEPLRLSRCCRRAMGSAYCSARDSGKPAHSSADQVHRMRSMHARVSATYPARIIETPMIIGTAKFCHTVGSF